MNNHSSKMPEEELFIEDKNKWLRSIIQTIPDLVWLKDTNGIYLMCNHKFEDFFGYKESDIIGKSDFDFIPNELALFFRQKDKEALEANKPSKNTEWITFSNDGHKEFVETIKTPMYGSDGTVIGILGIARDITAHSIAKDELRKFMLGIEYSSDAIFVTGLDGTIEFINPSFETIYGFSAAESIGKTPRILKSGFIPPEGYKHFWGTLLSGKPVNGELKNKTKEGRIIDVEASNNPIIDKEGNIVGFLSINRDITDKKQILNDLILAKEKAEESDRLKSAFLNNISHEVRTPLNAITGFSALLTMPDNDPATVSMYIETILKSSDQLLSIVHDIIDMSNIEAKASNIAIKTVNLKSLVDRLYKQFLPPASEKNLNLKINTAPSSEDLELLTDPSKLEKIFSNLINNAIKFSQKGTITFGYELKRSFVEFFVKDSGIGIPFEEHSKIFDKFYQVEKNLNRQFEGAGLGLTICKAFVEYLNGKIWLESEPGISSTFYFSLPFTKPVSHEEPIIKLSEALTASQNKQKTALVVEDNLINFRLIETFLGTIKFNVIHAVNGLDAVEICKTQKDIDLILMDIKMPRMDGYTAISKIREFLPDIVIIVQTAYPDNKENAISKGCNDFISKPFTIEQFILKVKENISIT